MGHPVLVSAAPLQQHLRTIADLGKPMAAVARASGLYNSTVSGILAGRIKNVTPAVAEKILTVDPATVEERRTVRDSVGVKHVRAHLRRVMQWPGSPSARQIAEFAGVAESTVHQVMKGSSTRHIDRKTARALLAVPVLLRGKPKNVRPGTVPLGPVHDHLRVIREAGGTWGAVAQLSGVSEATIMNLWKSTYASLLRTNADAILAVDPEQAALLAEDERFQHCERVPVDPVRKHLRALVDAGANTTDIAATAGVTFMQVRQALHSDAQTVAAPIAEWLLGVTAERLPLDPPMDAAPVKEHLAALRAAKVPYTSIAKVSGVYPETVRKIHAEKRSTVARSIGEAILSVHLRDVAQVDAWVDAQIVRDHLAMLASAGVTRRQVSRLSGLTEVNLGRISAGQTTRTLKKNADPILAITPFNTEASETAKIDGLGTRRRLRALMAAGYSQPNISARLGYSRVALGFLHTDTVAVRTARAVKALYEELEGTPGPDQWVRTWARNQGYLPPERWDRDRIDDPSYEPEPEYMPPRRGDRVSQRRAKVALLATAGQSVEAIAAATGSRPDIVADDLVLLREAGVLPSVEGGGTAARPKAS